MALSSPATAVAPQDSGRLSVGISATATTITVDPIFKTVNGVRTKQGFDTTSGICIISAGDFTERISFEGSSVNATTKVTSLTTCTRGLSVTSTTASFTAGTGKSWSKGANISVVADASYFQSGVYKSVATAFTAANTYSATQTFNAPVIIAGTTSYLKLPELTTTQRDDLTPTEGMMIKNSTTGTNQQYTGGAWSSVGTDATANGSTTVSGKFQEGTVAQQGTAEATGSTGSRLAVVTANLVKTSSGAGDENKIAVLNASGVLANGFVATSGTADSTTFLRGDRTWVVPSSALPTTLVGSMVLWTTNTAPSLWLLCYGQAVSRSTYSALFTAVSTAFGVGDGSTTFNLPDMRGRFPLGQDDMGGTPANRVTNAAADTIGLTAGTDDGTHTHTMTTDPDNGAGGSSINYSTGAATGSTSVIPPYQTFNYIIYANA